MQLSVMYELVDKMFSVITPTVYQRGIEALYVDYNPSHVTMRQHFSNHVSCHSFALNSSGEEITKVENDSETNQELSNISLDLQIKKLKMSQRSLYQNHRRLYQKSVSSWLIV